MVSRKKVTLWIILILLAGTALRFYRLDFQSLRNDELSSWVRSKHDTLKQVIDQGARPDYHPPGYYIMLYYTIRVLGDSEIALRSLSVLSGIISVFMIFLLGKIMYTSKTGVFAAAMMAFMFHPIYYSRDARMYAPLMLFTLAATYFALRISKDKKNGKHSDLFHIASMILCAIAATYMHYFGLLFILLLFGYFSLKFRRTIKQPTFAFSTLIILISYLPWWNEFFADLTSAKAIGVAVNLKTIASFAHFMFHGIFLLLAVCILFVIAGICLLRRKSKIRFRDSLFSKEFGLVMWILIPFSLVFWKSFLFTSTYANYTLIFCLPPAYLLVSRVIEFVFSDIRLRVTVLLALLTLSLTHTVYCESIYTRPQKQQFKHATKVIADHKKLAPNAVIIAYAWSGSYIEYYLERFGSHQKVDLVAGKMQDIPKLENLLAERDPKYIWFINAHRVPDEAFIRYLISHNNLLTAHSFIDANVLLLGVR